ncbi:carbamoyltransferase family protein [Nostoc sp. 'Peltigera membranacea cyanobiont' 232]|uniref:carbamoyltransferase family protein n=1 Tax=Nostoc sp. 'Peltigera membranacea cyanobiont' 232 TaxID=2014531 RepID=UPI000B95527B|nr:carbamoyltransferase C-terminal domain-containing protein [Nostoc sp. 'Peltigera membranacea cyanobiont' 232]OYE02679.1 nodulation protein [Nostoc sp. 'Peltigera membranacea cyanobiont' 232]
MRVLGYNGGLEVIHENLYNFPIGRDHDSAIVLVEDGEVIFAIEEERLNRIKHTNKFPSESLRLSLKSRDIQLEEVDIIACSASSKYYEMMLKYLFLHNASVPTIDPTIFFQHVFCRELNSEIDPHRLCFVTHHYAHAMSALAFSGYESSLVTTFDGEGEGSSGMVFEGKGTMLKQIANIPTSKSLGQFYYKIIAFLGYSLFDEYKVMGLAPYGDPKRYRNVFQTLYTLLPNGDYVIHQDKIISLFDLGVPRRKGEPFTQIHKDIAASLQETLENIVFHVLQYYRQETKQKNLCMAGGVAHNCTLNGKILRSGMFENVFVQPAAHDAGCALGAALYAYYNANPMAKKPSKLEHVYWGTDIGGSSSVLNQLMQWQHFIAFEKLMSVSEQTAKLLANGYVVGWVQGRSEFGPRALGNRSILADPRPDENKGRINKMIKKREGYRPFAPSVLEEDVDEFFEVPPNQKQLPFMIFVVNVIEDKRNLLGAVTHVDGTARVQTVSRKTNEKYWDLIHWFKKLTGVPILLNTSFNNNVEPIVDSVEDAVVCFLTTGLDYLVVGEYLIKKKEVSWQNYLSLKLLLPPHISLHQVKKVCTDSKFDNLFYIGNSYDTKFQVGVSAEVFRVLTLANSEKTVGNLLHENGETEEGKAQGIVKELMELWSQRLILLQP